MEEQRKRRAYRRFTEEFKDSAVRLVVQEAHTIAQVARNLDLAQSLLHGWVRRAMTNRGAGPLGPLTFEEREELRRLRNGKPILKQEKDILRAAATFFARDGR